MKEHKRYNIGILIGGVHTYFPKEHILGIAEAAEEIEGTDLEKTRSYLENRKMDMIVTSTDIDEIIKDFSDIISNGINITLHPGIYS